jgi:hypothetical protein
MLRTITGAVAAAALSLSSAAFAAMPAPPTQAPAKADSQHASAPTATHVGRAHAIALHRDGGAREDRETSALNDLEAAGYVAWKDVHADGRNVAVNAEKAGGNFQRLIVTPAGKIEPAT